MSLLSELLPLYCHAFRYIGRPGLYIAKSSKPNNPYFRWIETYASAEFSEAVDGVIEVFDILAGNASLEIRNRMLEEFYKSTIWEWHFWNDAYNRRVFDSLDL
tara:strand:+ start:53 stop:361 length:309 start_codon:yes stop_codon:yes gene_type:complete